MSINLEDINATIREHEPQIATYEIEKQAHSTPAGTSRPHSQITPDSSIATIQFLEYYGAVINGGNKNKSVRLGSKTLEINEDYYEGGEGA